MSGNFQKSNHASWQKIGLSVLCGILALVLIVMVFATAYVHYLLSRINRVSGEDETLSSADAATLGDDVDPDFTGPSVDHTDVTHSTVPEDELNKAEHIVNIMLIGQDRREGEPRQRSDAMILCTFNQENHTITMTSFLRDTYVQIPGYGGEKLNAAYAYGGFSLLKQTLAVNFGVHVDACAEVDFGRFKQVIDLLGGVDIELTEKEANHLNEKNGWNLPSGWVHMDGEEALQYARIRKIDMDAYRAGRQRKVLMALIDAYKNKSMSEMLGLVDDILPLITTDMTDSEIIGYVLDLFPLLASSTINTQQIPAAGTYEEMTVGKVSAAKVPDMETNRQILKEILGYE